MTGCLPSVGLTRMFGHFPPTIEVIILKVFGIIFGNPLVVPASAVMFCFSSRERAEVAVVVH